MYNQYGLPLLLALLWPFLWFFRSVRAFISFLALPFLNILIRRVDVLNSILRFFSTLYIVTVGSSTKNNTNWMANTNTKVLATNKEWYNLFRFVKNVNSYEHGNIIYFPGAGRWVIQLIKFSDGDFYSPFQLYMYKLSSIWHNIIKVMFRQLHLFHKIGAFILYIMIGSFTAF